MFKVINKNTRIVVSRITSIERAIMDAPNESNKHDIYLKNLKSHETCNITFLKYMNVSQFVRIA